ncbi:MAG: histidine kinase [Flavobacteriales bacterium]|nr:histidine kinase [Flavobacteriales bacterium]
MRIILSILLLLLLAIPQGYPSSGGDKILSPKKLERIKQEQDNKTLAQLQTIETTIESNPEDAIRSISEIIAYAIDKDLKNSIAYSYMLMGRCYKVLQEPNLALHFMELANKQYSRYLPKESKSSFSKNAVKEGIKREPLTTNPNAYYNDLGEIYSQLGDYDNSNINYFNFKEGNSDLAADRVADYAIAENYYAAEKYQEAISKYSKLLEIEKTAHNDLKIRECYSRLAACYISTGKTDKGLEYYNLSLRGIEQNASQGSYQSLTKGTELVTKALKSQNRVQDEIAVRNQSLNTLGTDGIEHLRLAQTYYEANDLVQAENSLDNYLSNVSYNLIDSKEIEIIKDMAKNLRDNNNPEKALAYVFTYEQLQDTIKNRLAYLEEKSKKLGAAGYQNMLQLEVLKKDKEMSKNMISHLMRESELLEESMSSQRYLIYVLGVALFLGLLTLVYIMRVSKQRRIANQQLALRSLRAQMNPHFIFNALNSVNSFISVSDERSANRFLSEFSTLMRTVMENSEHNFITLTKELEIIKIYMELEHFRFKDKFTYSMNVDSNLDEDSYNLPPMLIQPYIENAIWHGLRYKEKKGTLSVSITDEQGNLKVVIIDDGIGREKSKEVKTKNQRKTKSTALKNINERIKIFEDLHGIKVSVQLTDLNADGTGTKVTLLIPQQAHD